MTPPLVACQVVRLDSCGQGSMRNSLPQARSLLAWDRDLGRMGLMADVDCMAVLKALGEMNRLRIMRLLLKEQLGVSAIAHRLQMSEYNVSKHLRILKEAGLLEMEKSGKQRLYGVGAGMKSRLAANANVLELGCCTFRFDKLPK